MHLVEKLGLLVSISEAIQYDLELAKSGMLRVSAYGADVTNDQQQRYEKLVATIEKMIEHYQSLEEQGEPVSTSGSA